STFTIKTLAGYLGNDESWPRLEVEVRDWDAVAPALAGGAGSPPEGPADAAVVWTEPERVIPSFRRLLEGQRVPMEELLGEVDSYAASLAAVRRLARTVLAPAWVVPPHHRGLGMLDLTDPGGVSSALLRMNVRLTDALRAAPG